MTVAWTRGRRCWPSAWQPTRWPAFRRRAEAGRKPRRRIGFWPRTMSNGKPSSRRTGKARRSGCAPIARCCASRTPRNWTSTGNASTAWGCSRMKPNVAVRASHLRGHAGARAQGRGRNAGRPAGELPLDGRLQPHCGIGGQAAGYPAGVSGGSRGRHRGPDGTRPRPGASRRLVDLLSAQPGAARRRQVVGDGDGQ